MVNGFPTNYKNIKDEGSYPSYLNLFGNLDSARLDVNSGVIRMEQKPAEVYIPKFWFGYLFNMIILLLHHHDLRWKLSLVFQ